MLAATTSNLVHAQDILSAVSTDPWDAATASEDAWETEGGRLRRADRQP
jgi:hypothetical protein